MFRAAEPTSVMKCPAWSLFVCGTLFLFYGRPYAVAQCLTEPIAAQHLAHHPEWAACRTAQEYAVQQQVQQMHRHSHAATSRAPITISVVVHVVYNNATDNISTEQIQSQIAALNRDYRMRNPNVGDTPRDFLDRTADTGIEFCLASVDPQGRPTTGITRRQTGWANVSNIVASDGRRRVCYSTLGGQDAWDTKRYLNIWVARIGGGIFGFASYPNTAPEAEDGVFIEPRFFGTIGTVEAPQNQGRTVTHEVGHYLNLLHLWGRTESNCSDDDFVDDTPLQRDPFRGCPTFPQVSCSNRAMFMNFMDYTDDACMTCFTIGQRERMLASIQTYRAALLQADGCNGRVNVQRPLAMADHFESIQLYPNPVQAILYIHTEIPVFLTDNASIDVTDCWGRRWPLPLQIVSPTEASFDAAHLPAGLYCLYFQADSHVLSRKFIKI